MRQARILAILAHCGAAAVPTAALVVVHVHVKHVTVAPAGCRCARWRWRRGRYRTTRKRRRRGWRCTSRRWWWRRGRQPASLCRARCATLLVAAAAYRGWSMRRHRRCSRRCRRGAAAAAAAVFEASLSKHGANVERKRRHVRPGWWRGEVRHRVVPTNLPCRRVIRSRSLLRAIERSEPQAASTARISDLRRVLTPRPLPHASISARHRRCLGDASRARRNTKCRVRVMHGWTCSRRPGGWRARTLLCRCGNW